MISLDISLVWVIINLLVLYLLLKKFLFKPVCKMMDERSAKIQSDLDGAAQAKADAEKIKADYEAEIAMDDAKYQIADLAILAAAKVIKKNVGGDSDRETVDEFLSEVGAAK